MHLKFSGNNEAGFLELMSLNWCWFFKCIVYFSARLFYKKYWCYRVHFKLHLRRSPHNLFSRITNKKLWSGKPYAGIWIQAWPWMVHLWQAFISVQFFHCPSPWFMYTTRLRFSKFWQQMTALKNRVWVGRVSTEATGFSHADKSKDHMHNNIKRWWWLGLYKRF